MNPASICKSKKYLVEKPESINQLSKHIFDGDDNPFESMFSDARFNDALGPMRILRNFIAHDYEGVNKMIIEDIIRTQLPKLKQIILNIKN